MTAGRKRAAPAAMVQGLGGSGFLRIPFPVPEEINHQPSQDEDCQDPIDEAVVSIQDGFHVLVFSVYHMVIDSGFFTAEIVQEIGPGKAGGLQKGQEARHQSCEFSSGRWRRSVQDLIALD